MFYEALGVHDGEGVYADSLQLVKRLEGLEFVNKHHS